MYLRFRLERRAGDVPPLVISLSYEDVHKLVQKKSPDVKSGLLSKNLIVNRRGFLFSGSCFNLVFGDFEIS